MATADLAAYAENLVTSQKVRTFDVYVLGPFLVWAALKSGKGLSKWPRRALFSAGVFTLIYNWQAYKALANQVETTV